MAVGSTCLFAGGGAHPDAIATHFRSCAASQALTFARALNFSDGVRLVKKRGEAMQAASEARAVNGTDYAIQGIDVSHYQGSINWTSVKNSGKTFAFCKATEGTTYTDPTFATNWAAMKNVGLIRGAYHFGHPGSDPISQANRFCNGLRSRNAG